MRERERERERERSAKALEARQQILPCLTFTIPI
jgi:hypothetical protein